MRSKIRALVYKAAASFALPHAFSLSVLLSAVSFFLFALSPTVAQQITWQQTNGPYVGSIEVIAINSNGNVFAGTAGGVFRSTNNGDSWTPVNIGLTNTNVVSLTINSSGHIFAGTYSGGVFRSMNNGDSWVPVNTGLTNPSVVALAINDSRGHIFAGTLGGVFRSMNNGDSWMQLNTGLTNDDVFALAINSSTGHVFAGTYSGEVFRSTNNGDSWTAVNTGLTNTIIVFALAINSSGDIFAGTAGGVFRSMNNGDSWTAVNNGLTYTGVSALAINSREDIFVGTYIGGVFRSTNSGDSWTPVNIGLTISWFHTALAINASGYIFAGTSNGNVFGGTQGGGVFRSTNNGDSWVNIGVTAPNVYALAINSSGFIFAGTTTGGVFRSTNNGDSWISVNTGLTNLFVRSLAINANGHIFAGTFGGGVFLSTDNGDRWTPINNGLTDTLVYSLAINSSNGYVFAGTLGNVFRSTNNGSSWTRVNIDLTSSNGLPLAINSSDGYIFTGGGNRIFRSTDNGDSWTQVLELTDDDLLSLAINSRGYIFAGTIDSVFRSINNGDNWTPVNTGLGITPTLTFAFNSSEHVFAGMILYGIMRSRDNGDSWTLVNSGLPHTVKTVRALAIDANGRIFAGAAGALTGVYRTVESTELVVSVPDFAAPPHAVDTLSVAVNDASEITGTKFELKFDTNLLWVKDVKPASLTEAFVPVWSTTDSSLVINMAGATAIESGSGPLVNVTFKVNPTVNFGDSTAIMFAKSDLIDSGLHNILHLNQGGVFRVTTPERRGDVNADGNIGVPDAILCLRIAAGLPLPTYPPGHVTPTPYEFYTCDMNASGRIGVDDAILILRASLGLFAHKLLASTSGGCNVTLMPAKTNVQTGEILEGAVVAECDVVPAGAELTLSYDASAFSVTDKDILAAVSGTLVTPNTSEPGKIKALLVNLGGLLAPDGKMAIIRLTAKRSGDFTNPLVLDEVQLFDDRGDRITGVEESAATLPASFGLSQNYPNPFNPETNITYQLPKDAYVSLQIYNLTGQVVATLVNGKRPAGHHNALWNGRDETGRQLPSGTYFYRLLVNNGEWAQVMKMTLLK